jgi:subtilisin family serine protease
LPPGLGDSPVRVTLVTGDRVTLMRVEGELSTQVEPGLGRDSIEFTIREAGEHLYVVPTDAVGLLAPGLLDRRLFDVAGLVAAGYDDARRADIPLILQPEAAQDRAGPGNPPAPVPAATVTAAGAEATELPAVGATAVRQPKDRATELWDQLVTASAGENRTDPNAPGDRTLVDGVGAVWLDGVRHTLLDQSVAQVGAPQAWAAGYTGGDVRVAVLDSGVDVTHPDLAGQVVEAQNFTAEPDPDDLYGHGTHVAAIVGGTGTASGGRYRGVAPDADLLNGKVCRTGGVCFESEILAGMQWAAEAEARVVNMSLGGDDGPEVDPLEAAVDTLSASHDVLFVIAAGNSGPEAGTVGSPASADAALAVGAVDDGDQPAAFSSRGPRVGDSALKPDITAPGVGIVAAKARNGTIGDPVGDAHVSLGGTSMATPHVAGAAALVAQQHPDWTGAQIRALLVGSAHRLDGVDANTQGAGRLDIARAVGQTVTAEPAVVSAGQAEWPHDDDEPIDRTITYRNLGPEPVTLALAVEATGADGDAPEGMFSLDADTVTVPAGGEAPVELTVDTSVPGPDGRYSAWVTATDDPDSTTVVTTPVTVDREAESYDLTVELRGHDGQPAAEAVMDVFGLDNSIARGEGTLDGSVTMRLPRGRYAVSGVVLEERPVMSVTLAPNVELDRDRTLDMDARETEPIDVTLEREDAVLDTARVIFVLRRPAPMGDIRSSFIVHANHLEGGLFATRQIGPDLSGDVLTSSFQAALATAGVVGGDVPRERVYNLAWFDEGGMITGFAERVQEDQLARVQVTYRAVGPDRLGIAFAIAQPSGGEPLHADQLNWPMSLPHRRTILYNTDGVEWAGGVRVIDDSDGSFRQESAHTGEPRRMRPGNAGSETWSQAVFGPLVSDLSEWCNDFPREPSERVGDHITVSIAILGDGAGHPGCTNSASGRTTLRRDGEIVGESPFEGYGEFTVGPEPADYRLEVDATRPDGTHLATRTSAAWSFPSAHVPGAEPQRLPLMAVRLTPALDDRNRAPAGSRIPVRVTVERIGDIGRVRTPAVEVSFDDGATWAAVPVRRAEHRGFVATVQHPAGAGFVSLRTGARDDRGNAVEQTTIRAYELTTER